MVFLHLCDINHYFKKCYSHNIGFNTVILANTVGICELFLVKNSTRLVFSNKFALNTPLMSFIKLGGSKLEMTELVSTANKTNSDLLL
jgi:hypothetical protein